MDDARPAGESEVALEMLLFGGPSGKAFHALRNLHKALLALSLFDAGGRNADAKTGCGIEE